MTFTFTREEIDAALKKRKYNKGGARNYSHYKVDKPCLTPIYISLHAVYPHTLRPSSMKWIKRGCSDKCEITIIKATEICKCQPKSNLIKPIQSEYGSAITMTPLSMGQEWSIIYATNTPWEREPIRNTDVLADPNHNLNIGYWATGTCGYASVFMINGEWKILFGARKEGKTNILILHNIVGNHNFYELNWRANSSLDALMNGRFIDRASI